MTALYRHYDKAGGLLYVGISEHVIHRLGQHRKNARWFGRIDSIKVEHFGSREEAARAEMQAIVDEKPVYNVLGSLTNGKGAWGLYEVETGCADGFYYEYADALDQVLFWREIHPERTYELVRREPGTEASDRVFRALDKGWRIYTGCPQRTVLA